MKQYALAQGNDKRLFIEECDHFLLLGWTPVGGVSIHIRVSVEWYTQAFIK